jgi:glycosyltransferase involved in cell wall biosynthesis
MAEVASRIGGGDPVATSHVAPFEVTPFSSNGTWLGCGWRLRHLFRQWDPDAVFVHTDREHLIAAVACRLGGRGKVVRRTPAGTALHPGLGGRFAGWLTDTVYLFTDEADRRKASIGKGSRTSIAPLGVDVSRYPDTTVAGESPKPEDIRYIICVYDPTSRGRAATAIRTVSMLAPRHPYLRLLIFGTGSDSEDLRMQAAALDVMNLVSFLGERDDHLTLMRDAELGWVVAEGDTAAYGILDLMALGVPVIAAEGGVAETYVANLISGSMIPPDDAATTAATVVTLLSNPEQRKAMGAAARARVAREFPEQSMIAGFEAAVSGRGNP